jgi:type I restriction enzyme R subunit
MVLREVEKYQQEEAWFEMSKGDIHDIFTKIAPLVFVSEKDEAAKRFDLLIQNFKLSLLEQTPKQKYFQTEVIEISKKLVKLSNINKVKQQIPLLNAIQQEDYWRDTNIFLLETIREKLRDLIKYLPKAELTIYKTNLKDEIINVKEGEFTQTGFGKSQSYKEKFDSYIQTHRSNTIINKIFNNIKLTSAELEALDTLIFGHKDLNDRSAYQETYGNKPLAQLVRSVIGMDEQAVNSAFSGFINGFELSSAQYHFIQTIVKHFAQKGIIELKELAAPPYTDINDQGLFGVFIDENRQDQVIQIVKSLNRVGVG